MHKEQGKVNAFMVVTDYTVNGHVFNVDEYSLPHHAYTCQCVSACRICGLRFSLLVPYGSLQRDPIDMCIAKAQAVFGPRDVKQP